MEDTDSILSDFENREEEANPVQKIGVSVIDWGMEILLIVIFYNLFDFGNSDMPQSQWIVYILVGLIIIGYRFLTITFLGKTLGMIAIKLKYLNGNLNNLSLKERILTVFVVGLTDVKIYKQR